MRARIGPAGDQRDLRRLPIESHEALHLVAILRGFLQLVQAQPHTHIAEDAVQNVLKDRHYVLALREPHRRAPFFAIQFHAALLDVPEHALDPTGLMRIEERSASAVQTAEPDGLGFHRELQIVQAVLLVELQHRGTRIEHARHRPVFGVPIGRGKSGLKPLEREFDR